MVIGIGLRLARTVRKIVDIVVQPNGNLLAGYEFYRTNFLDYSADLTQSPWTKMGLAAMGMPNAQGWTLIQEDSSTGTVDHRVDQTIISYQANTKYWFSVDLLMYAATSLVSIGVGNSSAWSSGLGTLNIDLTTGVLSSVSNLTDYSATPISGIANAYNVRFAATSSSNVSVPGGFRVWAGGAGARVAAGRGVYIRNPQVSLAPSTKYQTTLSSQSVLPLQGSASSSALISQTTIGYSDANEPQWIGSGIKLNGNSYFQIPASLVNGNNVTILLVLTTPAAASINERIISFTHTTGDFAVFRDYTNNLLATRVNNNGTLTYPTLGTTGQFPVGSNARVAGFIMDRVALRITGILDGATSSSPQAIPALDTLTNSKLGSDPNGGSGWSGVIHAMYIFNKNLSAAELTQAYSQIKQRAARNGVIIQ